MPSLPSGHNKGESLVAMLTLVLEPQPSTTDPCYRPAQADGGRAGWAGGHLVYRQTSTHPAEPEGASPI